MFFRPKDETLGHPTPLFIEVPDRSLGSRPISTSKPNPARIISKLGFQPLKCVTLWVRIRVDMAQVLLLDPIVGSSL